MNLEQLLKAQQLAGKEYQTAINQLRETYIALAALDMTLANYGIQDRAADVRSFHPLLDNAGELTHPIFAPTVPSNWRAEISAKHVDLCDKFTGERPRIPPPA